MHERAIAAAQRAVELSHGAPTFVGFLGLEYAAAGHRDQARNILVQLQELSRQRYVTPYLVAQIYAAFGETDEALRWLEIAYRERAAWMVILKVDPRFDGLRSDPRFQDLMRRMNFAEAG